MPKKKTLLHASLNKMELMHFKIPKSKFLSVETAQTVIRTIGLSLVCETRGYYVFIICYVYYVLMQQILNGPLSILFLSVFCL